MMIEDGEQDGEQRRGGEGRAAPWDRFDAGPESEAVLFDVADLDGAATDWLPGVDYTRAMREAEAGERAVWRLLRGVARRGTWARTKAWCSPDGEPITRVDLHPEGWLQLEARVRDLEALAADGDRYRQLMARGGGHQDGDTGEKDAGRSWRGRYVRPLAVAALIRGVSLAR